MNQREAHKEVTEVTTRVVPRDRIALVSIFIETRALFIIDKYDLKKKSSL